MYASTVSDIQLDLFVQSIVSLTSLLMTNSLNALTKLYSNILIFLQQNMSYSQFFQQKISMYLPYFKIEITLSKLTTSLSFE